MMLEEALFAYLSTHAALVPLIGDRVYPGKLPQGVNYPAMTYGQVAGPRELTFGGDQGGHPRFDFTCTGKDYLSAKRVHVALRQALQGFSGLMGGAQGCTIVAAQLQNVIDLRDDTNELWHVVCDFRISYLGM